MRTRLLPLIPLVLAACSRGAAPAAPAPASTSPAGATAAPLSSQEQRIRQSVEANYERGVALLAEAVNIPSGTHNFAGVRRVSDLFARELEALGFDARWVPLPAALRRAGHLVAEKRGGRGPRLLLIGHLDTVFEGDDQRWTQQDTIGRGAGASDMKGGDVAIILALRALKDAGLLDSMSITVVMTGDEESAGRPLDVARRALVEAARRSDIALGFEGGTATRVAIGRRGASGWNLEVTARQAHSSGVFAPSVGYGAIYEGARILDEFRRTMTGERGLTFNVGLAAGGTMAEFDSSGTRLRAEGKDNIVAPRFVAAGDLRYLRDAQRDSARARMRAIVAQSLNGATARITFDDGYPAMAVTPANERLLAIFSATSQALGYPAVESTAPESRGAGDISFVAPYLPGIDGLGTNGFGAHSPREGVYLPSLKMSAERAAVFMARLQREWPTS